MLARGGLGSGGEGVKQPLECGDKEIEDRRWPTRLIAWGWRGVMVVWAMLCEGRWESREGGNEEDEGKEGVEVCSGYKRRMAAVMATVTGSAIARAVVFLRHRLRKDTEDST